MLVVSYVAVSPWLMQSAALQQLAVRVATFAATILRAIGVNAADGSAIDGDASLDPTDTRWQLVPRQPWTPGAYRVVALDTLEDPAGNRIGRAFEVPIDDRATPPAPRLTRTFTVAPPT